MEILGIPAAPMTEVGKCLFLPLKREIDYLVNYPRNIENLRSQANYLKARRIDLQNSIDEARRQLEEPTEEVIEWLKRMEDIEVDLRRLDEAIEENKRSLERCCCWCPSWGPRYRLSKEAAQKLVVLIQLQEKGNFNAISRHLPLPSIESTPVGDFEVFSSTELAMEQVMEALKDEETDVVGVFGMGGVGKTMLMKEVGKRVRREKRYDVVLMATVSRNPELKRIQGEIAEQLGLKLEEESESVRARRLLERFKQEKTVLVILDDLWERVELADVGIPYGIGHSGCKIVVTSRSVDVCGLMESRAKILVDVLSEEDSWNLFKKKAGCVVDSLDFLSMARDVARECGGLPLAIVTVGRALRDKSRLIWTNALTQLQKSVPTDIEGMHTKVFSSLMLSFDSIESEETKLCFLFCCLFPEDYNIHIDKLMRYVVGEGFLNDVTSLEEASQRVRILVDKLKSSCLLLDGSCEGFVKMHDTVRDAAISVASKDGRGFIVKVGLGLREWPAKEKLEECKRISLMKNRISILPDRPECPQLQTLLLQNNWRLTKIPDRFFEGMKALAVLDLNGTPISSLPPSLPCLINLRALCLHKCRLLKDISLVGELKMLEILRLNGTKISELPKEIGSLANLKLLDLSNTDRLKRVPCNMISKLTRLEELYMGRSFSQWEVNGKGDESNASFGEVASLVCLNVLQCHVEDVECLSQDVPRPWRNLMKFCICNDRNYNDSTFPRSLRLNISNQAPNWVNLLLGKTEDLSLLSCKGVKNLIQLHEGGFNILERLSINDGDEIEYLITVAEESPHNAFGMLKELYLDHMKNLKEICNGPLPADFLGKLKVLSIYHSEKLIRILPSDLLGNVNDLERLEVCGCDELQEVFHYDGLLEQRPLVSKLRALKLKLLPKLTTIWKGEIPVGSLGNIEDLYVGRCKRMKNLFSPSIAQRLEQLQQLEIKTCEELEKIISNEVEPKAVGERSASPSSIRVQPWLAFRNLQKLFIYNCINMKKLLSMKLARNLGKLEELKVQSCPNMVVIVAKDEDGEEAEALDHGLLPRLKTLTLHKLKNLTCFYQDGSVLDLKSLEYLKVWRCPELTRLPLGSQSVLKLEKIEGMDRERIDRLEWEDEAIKARIHELLQG
ncbi:probable disease resistance protein At4g27220 [Magnolia sinica]|uniref:probable disease resistance protein At4g27220 n=1 Tax=Magnolia sinica TaxID=86752 RepID=UPI00265B6091|nr:probable disease resistance protein At4g27220 [Magnolia sinica]